MLSFLYACLTCTDSGAVGMAMPIRIFMRSGSAEPDGSRICAGCRMCNEPGPELSLRLIYCSNTRNQGLHRPRRDAAACFPAIRPCGHGSRPFALGPASKLSQAYCIFVVI
ncbi:hypothetical protein PHLGIDRAFT_340146 [Phlebiopsis gigantea 11061_1 CR5-6]|uniref:Uncharacterized protein n=1 Tax=Phlebiopsis gigantea (strain 11061_1 CR5-6) TaxID=745531 RepID=A0A0C3SAL6_PHLG1|nr:hypothetical protein PHLGIDRAFT_340146 [Phlebiopsis gigantea 11061_1 CR5-6]